MQDISIYKDFKVIKPVLKGYSTDKKYYIETRGGEKLLLRISDISEFDKKKREYEAIREIAALNIIASSPMGFGVCDGGKSVYILLTWIEGEDANAKLSSFNNSEQYAIGMKAGEILRKIHTISAPQELGSWCEKFNRKIDARNKKVQDCDIKSRHEKRILDFINSNRQLLKNRPQCFQHGDFHAANLILTSKNEIAVIDFNRASYGDPYEEYDRIVFDATISSHFARGRIDGYFNGHIPDDFFPIMALYTTSAAIAAITWATQYDKTGIQFHINNVDAVIKWYDNLKTTTPNWYIQ